MKSEDCIEIIKNRLMTLINSGKLKATYRTSTSTISFYVNDIDMGERPLLTLRLTDHNPVYQKYIHKSLTPPSEGFNMNVSIEFYKPKFKPSGRKKRNRPDPFVKVPEDIHGVVPFSVNSYSYTPSLLNDNDIDKIYKAILNWIYGGLNAKYVDPFEGTPKQARTQFDVSKMTWNISHNISVDNEGNHQSAFGHGADYVSESKDIYNYKTIICNKNMNRNRNNVVRLTESRLRNVIKESVKQIIISEMYKNGKFYGEMFPNQPFNSEDEYRAAVEDSFNSYNKKNKEQKIKKERMDTENLQSTKSVKARFEDGYIYVTIDYDESEVNWAFIVNNHVVNEGTMEIELYLDNSWLPYEETHRPSNQIPPSLRPTIFKLFHKLNMREDEYEY